MSATNHFTPSKLYYQPTICPEVAFLPLRVDPIDDAGVELTGHWFDLENRTKASPKTFTIFVDVSKFNQWVQIQDESNIKTF